MTEFLTLLPPGEALARLFSYLPLIAPAWEEIETSRALHRVTAQPVQAPHPLPAFPRSTVDGFAVRAADTYGASESLPAYLSVIGEVPMGKSPDFEVQRGSAGLIFTGGMLPKGADAVVMVEHTQSSRPGEIEVLRAVAPGENIIAVGEDVAEGEEVIPAGQRLRPAEIGGLLALGYQRVRAARKPRVGILSSGDEVVPPEVEPGPGQVRDINSYALSALVEGAGGEPTLYGIVPDQVEMLRATVRRALDENDMIVITAGSSASTRDLTAGVIQEMGAPGVLVHGVNVRPGKPTILGVCDGKPVIGLPGNPVSALVIAGLFVTPVIERLLGISAGEVKASIPARLTVNLASQAGREDWIPVRLRSRADGGYDADPIFFKSNLIFNLARAQGLVRIDPDSTGLMAGELVNVVMML